MVLGQCAIGTDWADKRTELSLDLWRRHIDWYSSPIKIFAVPFHHEAEGSWRETATTAGIIFDRLRIASLVPNQPPAPLGAAMTQWATFRLKKAVQLEIA